MLNDGTYIKCAGSDCANLCTLIVWSEGPLSGFWCETCFEEADSKIYESEEVQNG